MTRDLFLGPFVLFSTTSPHYRLDRQNTLEAFFVSRRQVFWSLQRFPLPPRQPERMYRPFFVKAAGNAYLCHLKLEEAIVYLLASSGHGMRTEQIAREINARGLHIRQDKAPVTDKQVYAVIMSHPDTFVKSEGRIRLMI